MFAVITILLYLGVATLQYLGLTGKTLGYKTATSVFLFYSAGLLALALHGLLLYKWIDVVAGQNLSFFNMFSFAVWLIAGFILIAGVFQPLRNLAIFVFPLAALSIILALIYPGTTIMQTAAHPKQLLHILSAAVAFSILCLAAFQGLLLSIQESMLRHQYAGGIINQLPPLETMENLLFQIIWLGFALLTIVLMTSFYFFYELFASPALQHKTILALIAWIIFAVLLGGRYFFGWRGRKVTYYTLSGVLLLVIIYFG